MSLVVFDNGCFKYNIVEELGVSKKGQTVGYSVLPTKNFKASSQSAWCTKHLQGINWSIVYEKYTELEKRFKKLKAP